MIGEVEARRAGRHWEPLPTDPEYGVLDGRPVRLADVEREVPVHRWPDVGVQRPGVGLIRPWRGLWGF